ncbi:MAG: hypothetical protein ABIA74_04900 [bacterium]
MSGGALWQVILKENTSIKNINLCGVATEQIPGNGKIEKLICRGPVALYESFYPFALSKLNQEKQSK